MKFTDIFIRRPVLAVSLSLMIIILGLQAISKLAVREYPEMTTTVIQVNTVYPGADASLIQAFVTSKLEEAIAQADNIDYMSSSSRQNTSNITIKMQLNTDPNMALADILSKVNSVRSQLPDEIDDPMITSSTGGSGIMYIGFVSDKLNGSQITDYIERVVKPQFFTIEGVAKVNVFGGAPYALRIWLNPNKMAAQGLDATQVMASLKANNIQTAAGISNGYYNIYRNKVDTTTKNITDLENLVIRSHNHQIVRLKDIATVELNKESDNYRATANGSDAVVLGIEPTAAANPISVVKKIYPLFESIQKDLPSHLKANVLYDRTIAINSSIHDVIKTIFEATLIVLIVIGLFIGSFRAIFIPVVTIPISIIGVIMVLQMFGFSINLMTLLAMILAIGLVVDDAIVVLENVDRHIKLGETPFRAAIIGTREIAVPVISMTLALCAVYSPMALMGGITGALFQEFALTLSGAVLISGVVALTLSPMMSSKLLRSHEKSSRLEHCIIRVMTKINQGYMTLLEVMLQNRKSILAFAVAIFVSLPLLLHNLSSELAPTEDKGGFLGLATAPAHVNLDYMQEAMREYENLLHDIDEVEYSQIISGIPSSNQAIVVVSLKDWKQRSRGLQTIQSELNQKAKNLPEVSVNVFPFPEIETGEQGAPIGFVIISPYDYASLANVADKILKKARQSGLFVYADVDLKINTPQMHITVDREKAGTYGITMQQISTTLSSYLSAGTLERVDIDGRSYRVIPQVEREERLSPDAMKGYFVRAKDGQPIPLANLLKFELETQPASLSRFSQLNSAVISAVTGSLGSVGDAVNWFKNIAQEELPQGYHYDFKGESRQLVQEGNTLSITFMLAVIIIFLVLAIQFESIRDPMVIIISVPLAISGALLVLNILSFFRVPGASLNIYSEVGLITLVGLITKHGILICEVAKEEQLAGKNKFEAILQATSIRLRPILMTTAAMIAGLIPLLYASGAGSVSRFSIGVVLVGGLAIGTLFTLFVLPVIYTFIASDHKPLPVFDENEPVKTASNS